MAFTAPCLPGRSGCRHGRTQGLGGRGPAADHRVGPGVERLADLRVVRGLHRPGDQMQFAHPGERRIADRAGLRPGQYVFERRNHPGVLQQDHLRLLTGTEPGKSDSSPEVGRVGVDEIAPAAGAAHPARAVAVEAWAGRDTDPARHLGDRAVGRIAPGVGPVAQKDAAAAGEGVLRVRLHIGGDRGGRDAGLGELPHHREGPFRARPVQRDPALAVQYGGFRVGQELGDIAGQRLRHGPLPEESVRRVPRPLDGARGTQQFLPTAGHRPSVLGQQVLAVVEESAVGEEGQRVHGAAVFADPPQGRRVARPEVLGQQLLQRQRQGVGAELGRPGGVPEIDVRGG